MLLTFFYFLDPINYHYHSVKGITFVHQEVEKTLSQIRLEM